MGACYSSVAERVDVSAQGEKVLSLRENSTRRHSLKSPTWILKRTPSVSSSSKLSFLTALDSLANHGSHHMHSKIGQFDVFSAHRLCEETLAAVGYLALRDVAEKLSLPLKPLAAFCEAVDQNMLPNGYHSRLHVADVLQLMVLQTIDDGPISDICEDPIILLSALLGAFVHDLQHPGVTNAFLRSTNHEMFQKFGPESTAEKMHFGAFLALIDNPALDFLRPLGHRVRSRIIDLVEEIILSTDMARHSDFVSMDEPVGPESDIIKYRLSFAMKISDLSHCFRKFQIHRKFTGMLKQEFFAQGDKEIACGLPCSYGMNRDELFLDMAEDQVNFLSHFIQPLLSRYSDICYSSLINQLQDSLGGNIESWSVLADGDRDGLNNVDWELPSPATTSARLRLVKQMSDRILYCRPRQLLNIAMMHSMDARPFEVADSPTSTTSTLGDIAVIHHSLHTMRVVSADPPVRSFSLKHNDMAEMTWKIPSNRFSYFNVSDPVVEGRVVGHTDVEIMA